MTYEVFVPAVGNAAGSFCSWKMTGPKVLIKSFLEQARSGRSIPSNMVKAYLPIIDMIDEIVVAGPAYINLLKSVSKRAKKQI